MRDQNPRDGGNSNSRSPPLRFQHPLQRLHLRAELALAGVGDVAESNSSDCSCRAVCKGLGGGCIKLVGTGGSGAGGSTAGAHGGAVVAQPESTGGKASRQSISKGRSMRMGLGLVVRREGVEVCGGDGGMGRLFGLCSGHGGRLPRVGRIPPGLHAGGAGAVVDGAVVVQP